MANTSSLSLQTLRDAVKLQEQIENLQGRLANIIGGNRSSTNAPKSTAKGSRKMSAAGRARIAAAAKARWAKLKGGKSGSSKAAAKPKAAAKKSTRKGLTPEGRARLAAAMKARWAARKKAAAEKK